MKYLLHILMAILICAGAVNAQPLKGLKIYINPGHGGYDSNDRNVVIAPFAAGDTAGFWESKSNLVKGLHLRNLLESAGAQVIMSRTANRTEDDRSLSAIAEEANANRVDFMISVHSNAYNGLTNYPLMLFHGYDNNPILPQSMEVANLFWDYLISNQVTHWTYTKRNVRGDKSFAPANWDGYGVLRPLTVPGLISEGSFHDYLPETYRLMNDDYKRMEAWHHCMAFSKFYGGNPGKKGKIAGFVKDSTQKVTGYAFVAGSKDQWLPVNGARVTLIPGNSIYITDQLNNGFFTFNNLDPGIYQVKAEAAPYKTVVSPEIRVDSAGMAYYHFHLFPHSVTSPEIPAQQVSTLTIYPNPANTNINIRLANNEEINRYRITDLAGRTILQGIVLQQTPEVMLDIQEFSAGGYLLQLWQGDKYSNSLFIKQ